MTLTIQRLGTRAKCEACPRTIAHVLKNRLFVKAGAQMVVTEAADIMCKCGHWNHVALRDDSTS